MFGESDSESPRVPSPWDSLVGTPAPSCPSTPSSPPVVIPKLVPESDDGNVEYKLQLLHPSPARFDRLVTQMKWRLLEGGGQAYYELGVADSGALLGLPRHELEQSLETLEMMAGEIGASVIVVKEIHVPAVMANLVVVQDDHRRGKKIDEFFESSTELSTEDDDDDDATADVFDMDPEPSHIETPPFSIDLEISTVFKLRPFRSRIHNESLLGSTDHKRGSRNRKETAKDKRHNRSRNTDSHREARDRRREEKRLALVEYATNALAVSTPQGLVAGLDSLHVSVEENCVDNIPELAEDDDDVFPTPSLPSYTASIPPSHTLDGIPDIDTGEGKHFIVEALVVRKMSLDEGFLDFGGFGMI